MSGGRVKRAILLVLLMILAPLSGCFGSSDGDVSADNLTVGPEVLSSGEFQVVELSASSDMSVFIPYLVIDPSSGYAVSYTHLTLPTNREV